MADTDADALLRADESIELTSNTPKPSKETKVYTTPRRKRYWTRIRWASLCFLFTVGYPLPMTLLFIALSPGPSLPSSFGRDPCRAETMSSASLLAPDTLYGNFTVTQARAIDLSWNLIMGRGLPFCMAFIFFKVASMSLVKIAERTGVRYELFAAITLDLHAWYTVIPLTKATIRTAGWKAKMAFVFMLYSAILILAMPTLMDLQTGYVRRQEVAVRYRNGTVIAGVLLANDGSSSEGEEVCIDVSGYQWGWSFAWFSITHFLTGFWAAGSYIVWFYVTRNSILERSQRDTGPWRAVLDLAKAIEHDLGMTLDLVGEKALQKHLKSCPPVKYEIECGDDGLPATVALRTAAIHSEDKS